MSAKISRLRQELSDRQKQHMSPLCSVVVDEDQNRVRRAPRPVRGRTSRDHDVNVDRPVALSGKPGRRSVVNDVDLTLIERQQLSQLRQKSEEKLLRGRAFSLQVRQVSHLLLSVRRVASTPLLGRDPGFVALLTFDASP